jgi:hypothetical protein
MAQNHEKILYNYIEFFLSKDDLYSMMEIQDLDFDSWVKSVNDLYFDSKPNSGFHYNLKHSSGYHKIIEHLNQMKILVSKNKYKEIPALIKLIEDQYENLYYYDQIYVFAHHLFNNIRENEIKFGGGLITIEEFKQKIREKIKKLNN